MPLLFTAVLAGKAACLCRELPPMMRLEISPHDGFCWPLGISPTDWGSSAWGNYSEDRISFLGEGTEEVERMRGQGIPRHYPWSIPLGPHPDQCCERAAARLGSPEPEASSPWEAAWFASSTLSAFSKGAESAGRCPRSCWQWGRGGSYGVRCLHSLGTTTNHHPPLTQILFLLQKWPIYCPV